MFQLSGSHGSRHPNKEVQIRANTVQKCPDLSDPLNVTSKATWALPEPG